MIYEAIDKWNSPPDSYLEHHGVKGMKWGVRHDFFGIQKRRHKKLAQALEVAKREKKYYSQDYKHYSSPKTVASKRFQNLKQYGDNPNKKAKKWASISKDGERFFDRKVAQYSNLETTKISGKQVREAKRFMKNWSFHTEAEYGESYLRKSFK